MQHLLRMLGGVAVRVDPKSLIHRDCCTVAVPEGDAGRGMTASPISRPSLTAGSS